MEWQRKTLAWDVVRAGKQQTFRPNGAEFYDVSRALFPPARDSFFPLTPNLAPWTTLEWVTLHRERCMAVCGDCAGYCD